MNDPQREEEHAPPSLGLPYQNDYARELFARGFAVCYAKFLAVPFDRSFDEYFDVGYSVGSAEYIINLLNQRGVWVPVEVRERFESYRSKAAFSSLLELARRANTLDEVLAGLETTDLLNR